MMQGIKVLLCLMTIFGLMLLPLFSVTAQYNGSYTGSYNGTAVFPYYSNLPVSGSVAFTVSNNVVTVSTPGSGSGSISISGSTNFSGSGGALDATYTFTGTFVVGVSSITASGSWSAPLSDPYYGTGSASGTWTSTRPTTDVSNGQFGSLPLALQLLQNYPNPFNPSTTITYELPASSDVRLSVYDMLGREVSVLVNGMSEAGVHEVKFDGSNLASGVYLYRLNAGDFVQTRRLLLLR